MDSFPWLESSFLEFFCRNSISKNRTYSALCEESNGLIDFVPPIGFSFRADRTYSSALSRSISLKLPSRVFSIGFIHQSPHIARKEMLQSLFGPYFMYGKFAINEGGSLEAYYTQKLSANGHFSFSSLFEHFLEGGGSRLSAPSLNGLAETSSGAGPHSQSRTHLQWDFGRATLSSSYCTFGQILGLQLLANSHVLLGDSSAQSSSLTKANFGGEVYYTAQENSGGVSLGLRIIRHPKNHPKCPLVFTVTGNPLMGHYRATLTTRPFFSPSLTLSTRFDVNFSSFESDLAIGALYQPLPSINDTKDCSNDSSNDNNVIDPNTAPSKVGQSLRFAFGLKGGLSFCLETHLTEMMKIKVGLRTGPFKYPKVKRMYRDFGEFNNNGDGLARSLLLLPSSASFGLELAICN